MKRVYWGNVAGVGPVLKGFYSDADDPLTTPDTATGKFFFNSNIQTIGYILDIVAVSPDFVTYPAAGGSGLNPNRYYLPAGTDEDNCQIRISSWMNDGNSFQVFAYYQSWFTATYGLSYLPLVEYRLALDYVTNKFRGPYLDLRQGQATGQGKIFSWSGAISQMFIDLDSGYDSGAGANRASVKVGALTSSGAAPPTSRALMSVYALPAEADAIPNFAGNAVSGQEPIRISPSMFRIALPGYTVADTNLDHYIVHENKVPAKIMRSGSVTVPALGTVNITTRLPMTDTTYMDFLCKKSSEATYWNPPFIDSFNSHANDFTYTISGSTLTIVSTCDVSIDILYVIYADSGDAYTTGGSKVTVRASDAVGEYYQIKRPGSSDAAPGLNDILFDTRLSYLPILKEGFLNFPGDFPTDISGGSDRFKGVRKATVTVPNPQGLALFPKCGSVYNAPAPQDYDEPRVMWQHHSIFVNVGSDSGKSAGGSTWINPTSPTSVDIYTSGNQPWAVANGSYSSYNAQLKGVRYYIFGVPNSL
ncbi:hypothetical protein LB566_03195 [Mesorhizobium sp. CA13]|uniref:hypothetical protein n=1 Tax=Mesorhizobium sp. CA13 TaxID=2876643 RepID=UPI001CC90D9B|nr:hypothetical protein [Mesorhizobium sp. CA13]MBZ9852788.1 hypothetical protein [Mesorhizobium sp. CA13]